MNRVQELYEAIESCSVKSIEFILKQNVDPNCYLSQYGMSPLHLGVGLSEDRLDIVRLILQFGGDPNNVKNCSENLSPLHISILHNFENVLKLLLEFGGDPEICDEDGKNSFQLAKEQEDAPNLLEVLNNFVQKKNQKEEKENGNYSNSSTSTIKNDVDIDKNQAISFSSSKTKSYFPALPPTPKIMTPAPPPIDSNKVKRKIFQSAEKVKSTPTPTINKELAALAAVAVLEKREENVNWKIPAEIITNKLKEINDNMKKSFSDFEESLFDNQTQISDEKYPTINLDDLSSCLLTADEANKSNYSSSTSSFGFKSATTTTTNNSYYTAEAEDSKVVSAVSKCSPSPTKYEIKSLSTHLQELQIKYPITSSTYPTISKYVSITNNTCQIPVQEETGLSSELQMSLNDLDLINEWGNNLQIDFIQHINESQRSKSKSYHNYLLLDPKILKKTNFSGNHLKSDVINNCDKFECFINSIFYIGKGKNDRPMQHFIEAKETYYLKKSDLKKFNIELSEKTLKIHEIWRSGLGVNLLSVFHHSSESESCINEACMIDSIGVNSIDNVIKERLYTYGWMADTMRSSVEREHRERSQTLRTSTSPEKSSVFSHDDSTLQIRPKFKDKFNQFAIESLLEVILNDYFKEKKYSPEDVPNWVKELSNLINSKVKELGYKRYKLINFVSIGEIAGQGIHSSLRCLWDPETDLYATYNYMTDSLFCVATVCGVYYY